MQRPPRLRRAAGSLLLGALTAAACGSGQESNRPCGPEVRDRLDPAALVHVLGEASGLSYSTDPPTSGPHKPGPKEGGVLRNPLERPIQVGILERGDVLLQHSPDLDAEQLAHLEDLSSLRVVVAPNPDLPAAVVATAWTYTLRCTSLDAPALQAFIRARVGKGPGS